MITLSFLVCRAWHTTWWCKSTMGSNLQPLVEDNGVHREVESERSPRQNSGLKNMKFIRRITTDESAKQDNIQMVTQCCKV